MRATILVALAVVVGSLLVIFAAWSDHPFLHPSSGPLLPLAAIAVVGGLLVQTPLLIWLARWGRRVETVEGRLRAFLEESLDGFLIVNDRGQIVSASRQTGYLFGYERILGSGWIICPNDYWKFIITQSHG